MNSEWIEKLRAAAAMCRSPDDGLDYKYWAAVAFDMLPKASAYIGQQAASLDEAEALIKKNADQINGLLAQVATLQEIAVEEGAYRAYYEANARTESYADFGYSLVADGLFSAARDRLVEEHPEAFR